MRLVEFDTSTANTEKLAAIGQFFLSRTKDTNAKKTMPISTFLSLSKDMGVSLTFDQLQNLSQQPPLSEIIANIDGDEETGKIIFKGADEVAPNMSVDQARDTVDSMAKRALNKKGI
jgi:autotransporter adhesin